ncbi:MAG: AbrB/MazE/SpoVT family DNA-binding domain-containing protein [Candidatus Woesearchaeota archaeon]
MGNLEVTSLSSRGQVVIPEELREKMNLKKGEKFVVIGENGTILLKRIDMPSSKDFDKLLKKTQEFAKNKGIKPKDVDEAIQKART